MLAAAVVLLCVGLAGASEACETTDGVPCSFPFVYDNVLYSSCTSADHDQPWCYTETHPNNAGVVGVWGNCDSAEPACLTAACIDTDAGAQDARGAVCHGGYVWSDRCGYYDDNDFSSTGMCCGCGGGSSQVPTPGLTPAPTPAAPPPTASPTKDCNDTDGGAYDSFGGACGFYGVNPSICGLDDDDDFSALDMCCACGGGFQASPIGSTSPAAVAGGACHDTDRSALDAENHTCDLYRDNNSTTPVPCGDYDDDDFSATEMCCACDGGCVDQDGDGMLMDWMGYACDFYTLSQSYCAGYDDEDFTALLMCCSCAPAAPPSPAPPLPADPSAGCQDSEGSAVDNSQLGCSYGYTGMPWFCGRYDDSDFTSSYVCCECGSEGQSGCQDDDSQIAAIGMGSCASVGGLCSDASMGGFISHHCCATCSVTPAPPPASAGCEDDDSQIATIGMGSCASVGGYCSDASIGGFISYHCCATCTGTSSGCEDMDSDISSQLADSGWLVDGCADVAAYCSDASMGEFVSYYCCATCGGDSSPTPAPLPTPAWVLACLVDDDECLQQSPGWGWGFDCQSSIAWCESWGKDVQRCCPKACGTGILTESECAALAGDGTCIYPNTVQVCSDAVTTTAADAAGTTGVGDETAPAPSPSGGGVGGAHEECRDMDSEVAALMASMSLSVGGCADLAELCADPSLGGTVRTFCCSTCGTALSGCEDDDSQVVALGLPGWDSCAAVGAYCYGDAFLSYHCCATCAGLSSVCEDRDGFIKAELELKYGWVIDGCADVADYCSDPALGELIGSSCCLTCAGDSSPTPALSPSPAPALACLVDDDACLQQSPGWGSGFDCQSASTWCVSWGKDMQRCCPNACGTGVLTESECDALAGDGTCIYPNAVQVCSEAFTTTAADAAGTTGTGDEAAPAPAPSGGDVDGGLVGCQDMDSEVATLMASMGWSVSGCADLAEHCADPSLGGAVTAFCCSTCSATSPPSPAPPAASAGCEDDDSQIAAIGMGSCASIGGLCSDPSMGGFLSYHCCATCTGASSGCEDMDSDISSQLALSGWLIDGCADMAAYCSDASMGDFVAHYCCATCGGASSPSPQSGEPEGEGCWNNTGNAAGLYGFTCSRWSLSPLLCTLSFYYDDHDFTADLMCCACTSPAPAPPPPPTPPHAPNACLVDDDTCLQQSPGWGPDWQCDLATSWCLSFAKDVRRCCPNACGTGVLMESECAALAGSGTCVYPNSVQVCAESSTTAASDAARTTSTDNESAPAPTPSRPASQAVEFVVSQTITFAASGTKEAVARATTNMLASHYGVGASQVTVAVAGGHTAGARRLQSGQWQVDYSISVVDEESAGGILQAASTAAAGDAGPMVESMRLAFEGEGLTLDTSSVGVEPPVLVTNTASATSESASATTTSGGKLTDDIVDGEDVVDDDDDHNAVADDDDDDDHGGDENDSDADVDGEDDDIGDDDIDDDQATKDSQTTTSASTGQFLGSAAVASAAVESDGAEASSVGIILGIAAGVLLAVALVAGAMVVRVRARGAGRGNANGGVSEPKKDVASADGEQGDVVAASAI